MRHAALGLLLVAPLLVGCSTPQASTPGSDLLVVHEYDWLNSTAKEVHVFGSYGGHCAPARYTLAPPTLRIVYGGNQTPPIPLGAVVRDFRDSPQVPLAVTTSVDRLEFAPVSNETTLLVLFSTRDHPAWAMMNITRSDAGSFVVNGTTLHPSERYHTRVAWTFEDAGDRYEAAHEIVAEHAGRAAVSFERRDACA